MLNTDQKMDFGQDHFQGVLFFILFDLNSVKDR